MRTWLKEKRREKGLTQQTVAKRSGITQPFYNNVEKGNKNPSVDKAKRIAKVLSFDWTLFYGSQEPVTFSPIDENETE